MKTIEKVFYVLVFVALISFVGTLAGAEEKAKVNINAASAQELSALKGIGEKKAEAIVAYRDEHGPFATIEDITKVKGIGDKIFEKIKDLITVE